MISKAQIDLAAAAIANARAGRRGAPPIANVLELLGSLGSSERLRGLLSEVREDAAAALEAVGLPDLMNALRESVKLQSHYAGLLNMRDGGRRMIFVDADEWLDRLQKLNAEGKRPEAPSIPAQLDPGSVLSCGLGVGWTIVSTGTGYDILQHADGAAAIRCYKCGLFSLNANDVAQRYCGNCHRFHEAGL